MRPVARRIGAIASCLVLLAACHGPQGEPAPGSAMALASADAPGAAVQGHDACHLEWLGEIGAGEAFRARAGADVEARGWFASIDRTGPAKSPVLRLIAPSGAVGLDVSLDERMQRPDVAAALDAEGAASAGFRQVFSLAGLAPGDYRLVLVDRVAAGEAVCDNGRTLVITP
ncbi:MAG TPA: hypothetical protein VFQ84_00095 [Arenimonas sp.]|uniref:hypothetical protein n=1 Tax=Arenimonas sp. TaxID=1872635 RepID=UPI002D7FA29B|nr:hypothetical protein [Arenimonas sp.]HEU0151720.1 hypothetical protein [Arenimonas sp.]